MALKRRPCVTCGSNEKAKGNAKDCHECWLGRQPLHVQSQYARGRLELIPEELRLNSAPYQVPGREWCKGCQTFVRVGQYNARRKRCRACVATAGRESRLEREYSISREDYDRLFAAQGGRCYLCRRRSVRVPLAVDHDHKTGEVRGLLCPDVEWGCNVKIVARFDASADPLAMALRLVKYLRDPPARQVLGR